MAERNTCSIIFAHFTKQFKPSPKKSKSETSTFSKETSKTDGTF